MGWADRLSGDGEVDKDTLVAPRPFFIGFTPSYFDNSNLQFTMFHIVFSIASRFLYLGNMLQGFARGILAFRNLDIISSHLIPALPPPPPIPLLDAPKAFAELTDEIILPNVSAELFAIESQSPVFSSPISSYQSSSIIVSPGQFNLIVIVMIIIPGFLVLLPQIAYFFMNVAKISPAFPHLARKIFKSLRTNHISHLVPSGLPSQRILFRSLMTLASLLVLRIGPVRTHVSLHVTYVDQICSLPLCPSSFSPGPYASFSPEAKPRILYVCFYSSKGSNV